MSKKPSPANSVKKTYRQSRKGDALKGKHISPQHLKAIDEFFKNGFKQTDALLKAGYSKSTAEHAPHSVFSRPEVVAEIERRQKKLAEKQEVTVEWIVERLKRIASAPEVLAKFKKITPEGDIYWDFTGATEEDLAVITELTTDTYKDGKGKEARLVKKLKINSADPKGALDSLARYLGMFKDKVEVTGSLSLEERLQKGRERARAQEG